MAHPTQDHGREVAGSRAGNSPTLMAVTDAEFDLIDLETAPSTRPRAAWRSTRDKFWAGLSGWKHAIRGDSSFFAHGYRAFLVALTASFLGVGPQGWIALVLAGCLIFIAELNHSAIDTLARTVGDPDEPQLKVAREIAAGGVLAAVICSATVAIAILVLKFGDLLNWWR